MLPRTLKVAAVQFNIRLGDIEANWQSAEQGLRSVAAQGAKLAVLPEMWSSGYDYRQLAELAMHTPGILTKLRALSAELGLTIVGSLAEPDGDKVCNTAWVIDQGEIIGKYRKLHLFSTMGEDRFLHAGDQYLVVDTSVGRLGIAICYDLRFPELFRRMALDGAEIICLPAEWPKPRQEHWRTLLRARAIENQLFVVAANCCGVQGKLDFFGMSLLLSARGEVLAEAGEIATCLVAEFDFAEMAEYRQQIPCFRDRRPEIYGQL
ncbi:MAG: carbon-nitrogen family hydrolase [Desulfuromonadales bacterium]|nr:carbon-nitrogen family hydrolase [Desulfuromonadales bacterium]